MFVGEPRSREKVRYFSLRVRKVRFGRCVAHLENVLTEIHIFCEKITKKNYRGNFCKTIAFFVFFCYNRISWKGKGETESSVYEVENETHTKNKQRGILRAYRTEIGCGFFGAYSVLLQYYTIDNRSANERFALFFFAKE